MTTTIPVGFAPGPRTLRLMPAEEQARLDPYIAQIIGNRKRAFDLHLIY